MGIVLITEADLAVLEVEQASVADGHAMRIQGQIPQHRFGTAEWWLGIYDPVLADNCGEHLLELVRREAEVALGKRPTESGQELTAKHPAQDTNWKKEVAGRGDPATTV